MPFGKLRANGLGADLGAAIAARVFDGLLWAGSSDLVPDADVESGLALKCGNRSLRAQRNSLAQTRT